MTNRPVAPPEYRILLEVDYEKLAWDGTVSFDLPPGSPECTLDAEELTVRAVRLDGRPSEYPTDAARRQIVIPIPSNRPVRVDVDFSGVVDTKSLGGLYRSRHGTGYVLTTQCEPTGARRIFPCVDRPDCKAKIALTVRTAGDLEVVGNTVGRSTPLPDGRAEWRFSPTPPMSTYLFYLGIGRFEHGPERTGRVAVRVLTPPGRGVSGGFAAQAGDRILRAYEEYYGIPYPLPKLDLLAIEEHAFGAMENWGAISFQALRLLVDERSGSFAPRDVFETIGHEIAHQWFGNLVTMSWWDDIWLNESFASLMETRITEQLEPELGAGADFVLRTAGMAAAIDGDSLRCTHPVRAPVEHPEELSQIFDEISYGKGSSILAMLEAYLGGEAFRTAVSHYLRQFQYGNARTEDLWASLERVSGEPVTAIAGPWIERTGLPIVSASMTPAGLELTQQRFQYLGATDEEPWPIPIVMDVDGHRERLRLDGKRRTVPVPVDATVHLNPGATGFYRVRYDRTLAERLLKSLPGRPGADRWIVLEDLFAFLPSGDADWETYARFVRALGPTPDRLVVEALASDLSTLALTLPDVEPVGELARWFLGNAFDRLGPRRRPGENGSDGVLRERVSLARAQVDPEFARRLWSEFPVWDEIDPDLRSAVAVGIARAGGRAGYERLREAFGRPLPEVEALRMARAIAWSSEPSLVRETLEFALSGKVNRTRLAYVVIEAASNPAGETVAWPWLTQRVDSLTEIFRGSGYLPILFEGAIPHLARGRADEVRTYFRDHPFPEGVRGIAKGLERVEVAERLRARLGSLRPG
jgi:tricorn protease interacting factor F2/3